MEPAEQAQSRKRIRTAIIDIGSNSVRLVVYDGARRVPSTIFNEKVLAGLGQDLAETGRISDAAMARAAQALRRFYRLTREMGVASVRCVATAAVRDAVNGAELLGHASGFGLMVEVLSGEEEALYAAQGILSAFPQADGVVGDLGGGSLELAEVRAGQVHRRLSLPLGVLRVSALQERGGAALSHFIAHAMEAAGWKPQSIANFYCVGGSWRSLGRVEMARVDFPLRVVHGFSTSCERAIGLEAAIATQTEKELQSIPDISKGRVATLYDASALLAACCQLFAPDKVHFSAFGLREGLLYSTLSAEMAKADPLIVQTEEVGSAHARFQQHGRFMHEWTAPLFADLDENAERLRKAACNLSDVGWRANPDFRAERGLEIALHGHWVGISSAEREILGQAIWTCFGGGTKPFPTHTGLADAQRLRDAVAWGLALRLAERLSGGTQSVLEQCRIARDGNMLRLIFNQDAASLAGEQVERRLKQLAHWLHCDWAIEIG